MYTKQYDAENTNIMKWVTGFPLFIFPRNLASSLLHPSPLFVVLSL